MYTGFTERDPVNYKALNDDNLDRVMRDTAARERAVTLELLKLLAECERRHLFSKFACSILHAYCVQELKMSDGDAGRKVSAARLLREMPAIEEKVMSGSMPITSVAQVAVFFKREAKSGVIYEASEKFELVESLEDLSTRKIESILISKASQPEIHLRETQRAVAKDRTEIKIFVEDVTLGHLGKLKSLWSNATADASLSEVIKRMASECVKREERPIRSSRAPALEPTKASISRDIRQRDEGKCTYIDKHGRRCGSEHFLEEDHILPKAIGGEYSVENIRLRCRAHNQRHAIDSFGW